MCAALLLTQPAIKAINVSSFDVIKPFVAIENCIKGILGVASLVLVGCSLWKLHTSENATIKRTLEFINEKDGRCSGFRYFNKKSETERRLFGESSLVNEKGKEKVE